MKTYARWLLKQQPYFRAREGVLLAYIQSVENTNLRREDMIEELTFAKSDKGESQHTPSKSSITEFAALNLEAKLSQEEKTKSEQLFQWKRELNQIRHYLSMIDAAMMVLTPEEKILVEKHYYEGRSLEILSQMPLLDLIRSRSTLKRMLQNIFEKVAIVIQGRLPEDTFCDDTDIAK